jgi:2-octaprenylphenol hydroxylase
MSQTEIKPYDLVIVGGGMVGASLAALVAQLPQARDLRLAVVEAKHFSRELNGELFDPRVVALTESSRHMLEGIGVWAGAVADSACPYRFMKVRDSEGTGAISFDGAEVQRDNLGHIVENAILQGTLLRHIEQLDNVSLIYQSVERVGRNGKGNPYLIFADGSHLETTLLVAADGANSSIREQFDFPLRSWDYGHTAIVGTIRLEKPHGYTAWQWFMPTGPLAFLPLRSSDGDCHHASIVWSQNHPEAERLMALEPADFCRELTWASEGALGRVLDIGHRYGLPLRQRHAANYVSPGVVLVGDAAHTIHPLAGQGVNLGFGDVQALAEELGRGLSRGLDVADASVLQRYQRRRKPQNLAMMAAMESFKRLFGESMPVVRLLRNAGMSHVDRVGPLKKQLIRRAMGF